MASLCTHLSESRRGCELALLVASITFALLTHQVGARYLHPSNFGVGYYRDFHEDGSSPMLRRQDIDESSGDAEDTDELDDQSPAASYRNQEDGQPGQASDGYEDNEPDAAYEETPVEQEGQADLERFFDDHLGASDRDGMDKENLPSNLVVSLSKPDESARLLQVRPATSVQNPRVQAPIVFADRSGDSGSPLARSFYADSDHQADADHELDSKRAPPGQQTNVASDAERAAAAARSWADRLSATGSEVVITQDEDEDRVYVTNATNKPFKIDALGGYDPEADFQDAAKDLDSYGELQGVGHARPTGQGDEDEERESSDNVRRMGPQSGNKHEDGSHELPDSDMYEEASQLDEVTFGQDDPYQTDLEAEMRQQQYDRVGKFMTDGPVESAAAAASEDTDRHTERDPESVGDGQDGAEFNNDDGKVDPNDDDVDVDNEYRDNKPEAREDIDSGRTSETSRRRPSDDSEEGTWMNDGVDEMDIPSQSHQNFILDKAAKHDAMMRKAAKDEMEKQQQPESGEPSSDGEESQRMPNADYLKNDLIEDDSGYAA